MGERKMWCLRWLVLLLLSAAAYGQDSNLFEARTVGFSVTKPDDWHFMTAQENFENLQNVRLKDEALQQAVQKYARAPLVVITKYLEPFDDLNPSFKVDIRPLGQLKGADPKQILGLMLPQFQRAFQDFELVQAPTDAQVADYDAAYMRVNYSMAIPDGRKFPAASELWVVPRGDYFFLVGAGSRQDEATGSRSEIAEIVSSVSL